jgi:hypothetical protein
MPDPATGTLAAVTAGSKLLDFVGGQKAAKAAQESNQAALDLQQQQFAAAQARNAPATNILAPSIEQLQGAVGAPQQNFQSFLQAQPDVQSQLGGLSNLARANVLASAEATGNLGGSATTNDLLRIAPQLSFQLEDRNRANALQEFNAANLLNQQNVGNLANLVNIGLSGANQSNITGQNFAANQGNLLAQQGAINAGGFLTDIGSIIRSNQLANQPPAPISRSQGTAVPEFTNVNQDVLLGGR